MINSKRLECRSKEALHGYLLLACKSGEAGDSVFYLHHVH